MGSRGGSDAGAREVWRGPAVLAALVLLGVAGGYGASLASAPESGTSGVAEPVVAASPSLPVEPEDPPAQDPSDAPLRPGFPLETASMGSGRFAISFPVPAGWRTNENATNEAKWKKPGTSNNTYVMRVEQVLSQDMTIEEAIQRRIKELRDEQTGVEIRGRGEGSLEYTYVSDEGTFRHSFMRWLDVSGSGLAEVEVVVHGRERDVPGTRYLIQRVAEGMQPGLPD